MRVTLLALACLAAMSSPSIGETIYAPSGAVMSQASCKSNSTDCMKQASRECQGSYQVIDSESHAGGLLADWMPGPVTWYSMIYQCGPSDGRMPSFERRGPEWRPPVSTNCNVYGASIYCWSY